MGRPATGRTTTGDTPRAGGPADREWQRKQGMTCFRFFSSTTTPGLTSPGLTPWQAGKNRAPGRLGDRRDPGFHTGPRGCRNIARGETPDNAILRTDLAILRSSRRSLGRARPEHRISCGHEYFSPEAGPTLEPPPGKTTGRRVPAGFLRRRPTRSP